MATNDAPPSYDDLPTYDQAASAPMEPEGASQPAAYAQPQPQTQTYGQPQPVQYGVTGGAQMTQTQTHTQTNPNVQYAAAMQPTQTVQTVQTVPQAQMVQVRMPDGSMQLVMAVPSQQVGQTMVQPMVQPMVQVQQQQAQQPVINNSDATFGNVPVYGNYNPNKAANNGIQMNTMTNTVQSNQTSQMQDQTAPQMATAKEMEKHNYEQARREKQAKQIKVRRQRGMGILAVGILFVILGMTVTFSLFYLGIAMIIWGSIWACNLCPNTCGFGARR